MFQSAFVAIPACLFSVTNKYKNVVKETKLEILAIKLLRNSVENASHKVQLHLAGLPVRAGGDVRAMNIWYFFQYFKKIETGKPLVYFIIHQSDSNRKYSLTNDLTSSPSFDAHLSYGF